MSRATQLADIETGDGSGTLPTTCRCACQNLSPCIENVVFVRPRSGSFQTPRGGLHFRDSSRLLFSMYSNIVEEEDNKMTERWQKDADGILIFVSSHMRIHAPIGLNTNAKGRFILRHRRHATFRYNPGLEAGFSAAASASASGELGLLSQEHLSTSLPPERAM